MDLKLDTNGDLEVIGGEVSLLDGPEAIAQHLRIRLKTFLGEWFLNETIGMPYFEEFLIKNPSKLVIDTRMRQAITTTPGIASLTTLNYEFEPITRNLKLTFTAKLTSGENITLTYDEFILGSIS